MLGVHYKSRAPAHVQKCAGELYSSFAHHRMPSAFNGIFRQRRRLGAVYVCYIGKDIRETGVKFGFEAAFQGVTQ